MRPFTKQTPQPKNAASQRGFSLSGVATVVVIVGMFVVPFMRLTASSLKARQTQEAATSETMLAPARDALIAYAAANNGCLPFAADFEGGLPDTDATGAAGSYIDTGVGATDVLAGDLPRADLGMTDSSLDGGQLRVQYYVASAYADPTGNCDARFRGFEWDSSVTYYGSETNPFYVYYTAVGQPDGVARKCPSFRSSIPRAPSAASARFPRASRIRSGRSGATSIGVIHWS